MSLRSARVSLLATLAFAATLAPAAGAQSAFEGVVTFRGEQGTTTEYYLRGGATRVEMDMGGQRRVTIMNPATQTTYILLPDQQAYMEMPVRQGGPGGQAANEVKFTKTGKSDKIAGHACDYWRMEAGNGVTADICAASDMGTFAAMGGGGGRRGGGGGGGGGFAAGAARMAWQRALSAQNLFPLKVVMQMEGQEVTALEATKIEPKKLDASMFSPPASYQKREMPGRPGTE